MATVRNDRSGETITTDFTHAEAAARFAEAHGDQDHWLWFWVHKYAAQARPAAQANGNGGTVHGALRFLGDLFVVAIGQGLKRPMLRLHWRGRRFKFYLSRKGTVCLKTGRLAPIMVNDPVTGEERRAKHHAPVVGHPEDCRGCVKDKDLIGQVAFSHDPEGNEEYAGCLLGGRFLPSTDRYRDQNGNWRNGDARELDETEQDFLRRLEEDPVGFMARCSKDMGRCCYCNQPLEDARSKQVGYGKTCAAHWGLSWGDAAYMEKAPSFAKLYNDEAAAVIAKIREKPEDEGAWLVFADWLEERELPRCAPPKAGAVLPRS